jgi:hypothetical protein
MKKLRSTILASLLLATVAVTWASTLWVGSYTVVNNTTFDSPTNAAASYNYVAPAMTFYLSNNLARTSDINIYGDVSLDGINWTNAWSYSFPQTNAGTYTTNPGTIPMAIFGRIRVVDTNANTLAVSSTP